MRRSVSFLRLALKRILVLSVGFFLAGCGEKDASPGSSSGGAVIEPRVIGIAFPGEALENALSDDEVSLESSCFRVIQDQFDGPMKFQVLDGQCQQKGQVLISYDLREWVGNPGNQKTYFIFHQSLPLGELLVTQGKWVLQDLCSVDPFYKESCELDVVQGKVIGVKANPEASIVRLQADRKIMAENEKLKSQGQKDSNDLKRLTDHLQALSKEIVGNQDAMKSVLESLDAQVSESEAKVLENLVGTPVQEGAEKALEASTLSIRNLSMELSAAQAQLKVQEDAYLQQTAEIGQLDSELNALFAKRLDLKRNKVDEGMGEAFAAWKQDLETTEKLISELVLKLSDKKDEASKKLSELQASEVYSQQQKLHASLTEAKAKNEVMQRRLLVLREKVALIQSLKNHLATARKLVAQGNLKETTTLLPTMGKLVEKLNATPI